MLCIKTDEIYVTEMIKHLEIFRETRNLPSLPVIMLSPDFFHSVFSCIKEDLISINSRHLM